jgi:hypothetical protein
MALGTKTTTLNINPKGWRSIAYLLAAVKAVNPMANSLQLSPVNVMGMSKKEIVISVVIAFGSAVAANNVVDAANAVSAYFHTAGIQATQLETPHTSSGSDTKPP